MISFRIEMLGEVFTATSAHDSANPEWPPNPARVFSAMTSVVKEHWNPYTMTKGTELLQWLQEQGNPSMCFSEATGMTRTIYVPTNTNLTGKSRKTGRDWNESYPASPVLWYTWDADLPGNESYNVAVAIADGLTRLGHSSNVVVTTFHVDECPPAQYVPSSEGTLFMRGISCTQIQDLEEHYRCNPEHAGVLPYEEVAYAPVAPPESAQIYGPSVILEVCGGVEIDLLRAHQLAKSMRYYLISLLKDPSSMISGHSSDGSPAPHAHLAIIPLPYVGHRGDGGIKGFAFCLPKTAGAEASLELQRAFSLWAEDRDQGTSEFLGEPLLEFGVGSEGSMFLRKQSEATRRTTDWGAWTQPATEWSTVTPMLSVSYPKSKGRNRTEELIRRHCLRAGLPDPIEISFHRHSLWEGCPHDSSFRDLRIGHHAPWTSHVTLRFAEPVAGPILIGAGVHRGLGLMKSPNK